MVHPFDDAYRRRIESLLAAFSRVPTNEATRGLKPAAVAITLLPAEDNPDATAFLLTRRATGLRSHGGQWALPGGICDERETVVDAALRELDEEVGLRLRVKDVIGVLDDYPTRSGYLITPVVLWAGAAVRLSPNRQEVESIHRIPLAKITRADAVDFVSIPESDRQVIRIWINGGWVHAPTAALIYQFCEVLAGRATRVADLEQPVFAWR
jgi:8-oxo-dGTP pyrophosphatase MutT (NUDIX family)